MWVASWSTVVGEFGCVGGNSVVWTEVWEGGSELVAGKLVPKGVSQRRCPMGREGHHPRAAAGTSHSDT